MSLLLHGELLVLLNGELLLVVLLLVLLLLLEVLLRAVGCSLVTRQARARPEVRLQAGLQRGDLRTLRLQHVLELLRSQEFKDRENAAAQLFCWWASHAA